MPRRQKARRQMSSDEEMEAVPDANESVPATALPQENQEGGANDLDAFEPDKYERAILSAASHTKMRAITEGWDIPKPAFELLFSMLSDSASMLTEAGEVDDPMLLRNLDQTMKDVIDLQYKNVAQRKASVELREDLIKAAKISNPSELWQKKVEAMMKEYSKKTSRQKYADNTAYTSYREEIWQVKHDGPMPPLKSIIPKENGDESDDDDDLEVGGKTVSFKDPLSRLWLEDPMTSKLCGHSYSRKAILEFLGPGGTKMCPEAGCDKRISKADLEENENLARQVRNARRREEERKRPTALATQSIDVDDDEIVD